MNIDFSNDKPIYLQFADIIKRDIIVGKFRTTDKLPSVREFSNEYSINPNTVQKALQLLEDEGLIITDRTNGKYVVDNIKQIEKTKQQLIEEELKLFLSRMNDIGLDIIDIKKLIESIGE